MKIFTIVLITLCTLLSCSKEQNPENEPEIVIRKDLKPATGAIFYPLFQSTPNFFRPRDYSVNQIKEYKNKIYIVSSGGIGVSNDNGDTFTFQKVKGISQSRIKSLSFIDNQVFIGTYRGLFITDLNLQNIKTYTHKQGLGKSNTTVNRVFKSGKIVYIATNNGIYTTDKDFLKFNLMSLRNNINDIIVVTPPTDKEYIFASANNGLYLSTNGGRTFNKFNNKKVGGANYFNKILVSQNKIFIATDKGLAVTSNFGKKFTLITSKNNLPSNNISNFIITDSDEIIVTTYNGIAISIDGGKRFKVYSTLSGLPEKGINDVIKVKETGKIIMASVTGLIETENLDNSDFIKREVYDLISEQMDINSIYAYDKDNILIGTRLGLLYTKDGGTSTVDKRGAFNIGDEEINDIFLLNNKTYIATSVGLGKSIHHTVKKRKEMNLNFSTYFKDTPFYKIKKNKYFLMLATLLTNEDNTTENRIIFIETNNNGNVEDSSYSVGFAEGIPNRKINDLDVFSKVKDNDVGYEKSHIFIGTEVGLFHSYGTNNFERCSKDIPEVNITSVNIENEFIYVTTDKALYVSEDLGITYKKTSIISDFSPEVINKLAVTKSNIFIATTEGLWASTNNGLNFKKVDIENEKKLKNFSLDVKSLYILNGENSFIVYAGTKSNLFKSEEIAY